MLYIHLGEGTDERGIISDLAANVDIAFETPEEFFLDQPPEPFAREFEPEHFLEQESPPSGEKQQGNVYAPGVKSSLNPDPTATTFVKRNPLDLVIFCGSPGAGKSTFYWENLKPLGYERVNQDILKSVSSAMIPMWNVPKIEQAW